MVHEALKLKIKNWTYRVNSYIVEFSFAASARSVHFRSVVFFEAVFKAEGFREEGLKSPRFYRFFFERSSFLLFRAFQLTTELHVFAIQVIAKRRFERFQRWKDVSLQFSNSPQKGEFPYLSIQLLSEFIRPPNWPSFELTWVSYYFDCAQQKKPLCDSTTSHSEKSRKKKNETKLFKKKYIYLDII